MLELCLDIAASRFRRRAEDVAVGVEFPALVNAPEASLLVAPEKHEPRFKQRSSAITLAPRLT